MAGEVKYDSLPFIDSSGKDCYESGGELLDQSYENVELKSESVEHIQLNHSKSFSTFQNKYLDSSKIDFSDKILSARKSGYESKSVYEIIGEQVAKETPQQKYQRLQLELKELAEEVQKIQNDASNESKDTSPVVLSQQVSNLQKDLQNLHLEKILGSEGTATDGLQKGTWTRQIVNQLQSFKAPSASSKENTDTKDGVLYEMYYRPDHARFAQAGKISELEAKLKDIENFVGKDKQKLEDACAKIAAAATQRELRKQNLCETLTSNVSRCDLKQSVIADPESSTNLMNATASIQAKLTLFDISHIDMIAARLQGLLHCINEISQKKDAVENVDQQTKVNDLHKLVTGWESVASVVPDLIERLKSLHAINDQGTTFSQSLEHLTTTQTEIRDQLRAQKDMLEKYEKSFEENVKAIQQNCSSLENRMSEVMKKVAP